MLYQTLQQLVKFHASMQALGGESCTQVLMEDFDTQLSGNGLESAGLKRPMGRHLELEERFDCLVVDEIQ